MRKIAIGNSVYIKYDDVTLELDRIEINNTINSSFNIEIIRNNNVIKSVEFPLENNSLYKGDYLSRDGIHRADTGRIEEYVGDQLTAIQYFDNLYISGGNFYVKVSNENAILKLYYEKQEEIDEQIYVLNKNEELIAVLNKDDEEPIFNPRIKETQNAEAVFTFSIAANNPKWKEIKNPENLYVVDGKVFSTNFEGCFQESITETNEDYINVIAYERQKLLSRKYVRAWNSETGFEYIDTFMVVVLSAGSLPLKNNGNLVESRNPRGTSGYVLDALLYGTGWKTGTCDVEGVFDFETDQVDIYENILKVQQIWGGILVFDSYNKIVHHRDETKWLPYEGFEVKYQKNMQSLERLYNNKIVTKLCPLGEGGLNIKSVNNNVEWLTDFSYTDSVLEGIENNPDITDPEQLKAWGERKLKFLCKPRKELTVQAILMFQLEGYELEKIYLNDIADIINYDGVEGEIEQLRVVGYDYGIWDKSDAILELSDITLDSTDIFKQTVSASNSINNGTLNANRVVNFFENGQSISASLKEIDKSIEETKSEMYKSDTEIGVKIQETITNMNTLSNQIINQQETIESLKVGLDGVTNELTEKGGNNLIYYDKEFWTGKSTSLPSEYEKVKYIKSTRTQYIDTGYMPTPNTELELDLKFDGNFSKSGSPTFVGTTGDLGSSFSIFFSTGSKGEYNSINIVTDKSLHLNAYENSILFVRNKIKMKSGLFEYVDTMSIANKTLNNDTTLCLFGDNQKGVFEAFGVYDMVVYGAKIYEDGVLLRDFIPCIRKGDGVAGLYDIVNYIFYPNNGTGQFEYEYDIPEEYQEIEYLESNGTQYIDTGYFANINTRVVAKLFTTEVANKNWFGGSVIGSGATADGFAFNSMSENSIEYLFGNSGWNTETVYDATNSLIALDFSNQYIYINSDTAARPQVTTFTEQTLSLCLFARNGGSANISGRIYAFEIYEGSTLVRNFIPCYRKEDNVAGFYDMVNGVFYQNAGTGTFIKGNDVSGNEETYIIDKIEEYTDTEIQNNSVSGLGYILNNGNFEQSINNIVNGIYAVSFKYKKLKELATGSFYLNDVKYDLTEMEWTNFVQIIEVNSNNITVRFESDSTKSFYITDLLINLGNVAEIWTQNPNETRTDTVKIGKGIEITSSVKDTKLKADADGVRVVKASNEKETVTEFTDKGTKTERLETPEGEIAGLLFQEVTYKGSEQTWISSLL